MVLFFWDLSTLRSAGLQVCDGEVQGIVGFISSYRMLITFYDLQLISTRT